ncbi:MAG: rod shape-determining protein MreB [Clostridia bacterium]|nr:rod shape-determining protein MreB [Clostridia bacterium]
MELSLFDRLSRMIVIDLGTVNTLMADAGRGILLREPSVAVVDADTRRVVALGSEEVKRKSQLQGGVRTLYPMRDGVVTDIELASQLIAGFIRRALGKAPRLFGVNAVICVPGCATAVERQAIEEAAYRAGIKKTFVMSEPVAAALGAGLPVYREDGCMVADIGGGTTDVAVMSKNGVESVKSSKRGSVHMNEAIVRLVWARYGIDIGDEAAEELKREIGLKPGRDTVRVSGRRLDTGLPDVILVEPACIAEALRAEADKVVGLISEALLDAPAGLAAHVMERGIVLTGGGALLKGIDEHIARETGVRVRVAEDCMDCVMLGALHMAQELLYGSDIRDEEAEPYTVSI